MVESLRQNLEKLGSEVFIVAPEFPHYQDKENNILRVPSYFLPNRPESPIAKPIASKFYKTVENYELDIIHSFTVYTIGTFGLNCSKKFHKPIVFTFDTLYTEHTKNFRPLYKPFAKMWYQKQLISMANSCQLTLVPTPSTRSLAEEFGVITPIEILPSGVSVNDYTSITPAALRAKFSIPEGQSVLLYVGRLDEESNVRFLLRAFHEIYLRRENTHLLIIGRGAQEDLFQKIASKQPFGDNVTFAGFMPKGELNKIYGACDIFVFPSTTATQAIAIIEAMAAGIPVVAINRLAPSNIIRDDEDGYLTPLNEKVFADKILYLLENDKIRNNFGRVARAHAAKFSGDHSAKRLNDIYKKLL